MKNKKKKISLKSFKRIFTILAILIVYLLTLKILGKTNFNKDEEQITVLLNNKEYSTINEIYVDVLNEVYFSVEDMKNIFDKDIVFYQEKNMLVSTYNMHVLELKLDENIACVNNVNVEIQGALKYLGEKLYLPVTELGIVYDYDFSYSKENKVVMIDSQKNEKKVSKIEEETDLLEEPKFFTSKITKLSKDTVLTVLEENEKYLKVRTDSGLIGYVKTKKASPTSISRENFVETKKELNVLWDYTEISKITQELEIKEGAFNIIIPSIITLNPSSDTNKIRVSISDKNKEKIKFATNQDVKIIPYLTDSKIEDLTELLNDYDKRKVLITEIIEDSVKNDLGGITFDFSKVTTDNIEYVERFLLELKPYLKEYGKKLIVNKKDIYTEKIYNIADYTIEK